MELICKRCKKKWNYKGKRIYYTTCPGCHTTVRIIKEDVKTNTTTEKKELESDKIIEMCREI